MNTWIYNCLHLLLIIKEIKYLNKECFQIPSILTMENQNIKKQSDSEFVCKLLDMITKYPLIINWNQLGDQMDIIDIERMQSEVLPQYFRHSNFSSFVRQLNMYNFHKLIKQQNSISFKNQIFFKGNDKNYHFIQRKKKTKDQEIFNVEFEKKYNSIIKKLKKEHLFPSTIKQSILTLLQFKHIMIQNIKTIRNNLDHICKELKDCRTKKIIDLVKDIRESLMEQIAQNLKNSKQIDRHIDAAFQQQYQNRQKIPVHIISNNSPYQPFFQESQSRTIKDLMFDNRFKSMNSWMRIPSNNNILAQNDANLININSSFKSHPLFGDHSFPEKYDSTILAKQHYVYEQQEQKHEGAEQQESQVSMDFVEGGQNYQLKSKR